MAYLEGNVGPSWGYVGPSWGYVGPSWSYVGPSWSYVGPSWGYVGPSWGLCWPILRLCWSILRPMLPQLTHLEPQDPKNRKTMLNVTGPKKTVNYRGFCRHAHPTGGRRQGAQPLSPMERRELPYGKDTARGALAGFKRLRATAGQGPNYVGPSCGYMLAYAGVCWPILRATWAHLAARLAYVCLMLAHVEPKGPKNGKSKKTL